MNNSVWEKRRKRLFELIEIGSNYDSKSFRWIQEKETT